MRFTLRYPPSANNYWRFPRALGRPILSAEARAYKRTIGMEALAQGVRPMAGDLIVSLAVYRPMRRGDLDNTAKVLLDSLNGVAWVDDSQIIELHMQRFDDKTAPRVEVTVNRVEI